VLAQLDRLADRLESAPLALRQHAVQVIQQFGGFLLDYNKNYLQKEGKRPDGEIIQDTGYSNAYAAYKRKYGRFTNTAFVDLKFSGDFLESFALEYQGSLRFAIVANDKKAALLLKTYGPLLGVREADILDFIGTYLEPALRQFLTSYFTS
jgi:hypothetical protein